MSSETSTDALTRRDDPSFEPWQLFTLAGLMGATVVVFMSQGQTPAGIILLSLTIFTAAAVGVAAWRTLAPFTQSDHRATPVALGGRARAALERDKALVLRALKDLEFDRAMGKISDKDFAEMSGRLRLRATRILRQIDAGSSYRDRIEREVARRLGTSTRASASTAAPAPNRPRRLCQQTAREHAPRAGKTAISTHDSANTAAPVWSQGDERPNLLLQALDFGRWARLHGLGGLGLGLRTAGAGRNVLAPWGGRWICTDRHARSVADPRKGAPGV
jgi:hypothetical protein